MVTNCDVINTFLMACLQQGTEGEKRLWVEGNSYRYTTVLSTTVRLKHAENLKLKKVLAEIASLQWFIPAQNSLFEILTNKQSQWITIMSVSPELCKLLSKTGRQQIHVPTHLAHCINEHTHVPSNSYRCAWAGHSGM